MGHFYEKMDASQALPEKLNLRLGQDATWVIINALWQKLLVISVKVTDICTVHAFCIIQVDQISFAVPSVTCPKRYQI